MPERAYRHQEIAAAPRGWRVRTHRAGDHLARVAFPPGRRRRGAGKLVSILHPKGNPSCADAKCNAAKNPEELLIFGNPAKRKRRNAGTAHHKRGCPCFACKYKRGENPKRRARKSNWYFSLRDLKRLAPHFPGGLEREIRAAQEGKKVWGEKAADGSYDFIFEKPKGKGLLSRILGNPKRKRRNAEASHQAVKLFQSFHGKDPSAVIEKHISAAVRSEYTVLGDLEYLVFQPDEGKAVKVNFEGDGVKLASSPEGKQLYCIGGNQNLAACLEKFTDDPEKDFLDLGEACEVQYLARKIHSKFEPTSYYHKFGETGKARPRGIYDKLRKQVFIAGGEYFIKAEGISPGIEG